MKKILTILSLAALPFIATKVEAQCFTSPNQGGNPPLYTPSICNGTAGIITNTGQSGQFSPVQVTAGNTYTFSSSIATDYITITDGGGTTAFKFGTGPQTYTATTTTTLRFYDHSNAACGTDALTRSRMVSCAAPVTGIFYNNASLYISPGATLTLNANYIDDDNTNLKNYGTLLLRGDFSYGSSSAPSYAGTVKFNGNSPQTFTGNEQFITDTFFINNPAGLTINGPFGVLKQLNFQSGIVNVPLQNNFLIDNGTISSTNPAKDDSHVKGYIAKFGTGSFIYPVGNGTKYQPIAINITATDNFFNVKYNDGDAGNAPFTTNGSEVVPLASYNNKEYWELIPLENATGTVTLFWDGYKDAYSNPAIQRRVAHKRGGNWVNEGSALTTTGNAMAGSVTSNSISNWSPFALGSVLTVLPVKWLNVSGNLNANKNAIITWKVSEQDVNNYEVEKSVNSGSFVGIGTKPSAGSGTNTYSFTENTALGGSAVYRVKQMGKDGQTSYSEAVKLTANEGAGAISVYPNPATDKITVAVPAALLNTTATLTDISGRKLQSIVINSLNSQINVSNLAAGTYIITFSDGSKAQVIKK